MARLDHVNARLAARRTRLVPGGFIRELLTRPGLEARLAAVRATAAGAGVPAVPVAGEDAALDAAEAALWASVAEDATFVLREAEGARVRALVAAYLDLEEAAVVKAVVRGVSRGAPAAATRAAAPPVPAIAPAAVAAAAEASDVAAALRALADGGSALARVAAAQGPPAQPGSLVALELAVDHAAFARARAACAAHGADAAILAGHLADRIDLRNATTLLLGNGAEGAADPWLEGGTRLAPGRLRALARGPRDVALSAVAKAFGTRPLASGEPWDVERALDAAVREALHRAARREPLSLAVPLWYLAERRAEARRLALALRGAALGLPLETILGAEEA